MSRYDVANAVGVHYQTIGYIERGDCNPSLQLALRLADFFRLPVEAIFSLTRFSPLSEQVYAPPSPHPHAQTHARESAP